MSPEKYLSAIYCDDIRREEGNKLSYMGVYGTNLLVPTFPQVLPKLCVAIRMTMSPERPKQLIFRLLRDEEVIVEREVDLEAFPLERPPETDSSEVPMHVIATVFQLFPLELTGPCKFRARALCDGDEYKGGSLIVDTLRADLQIGGANVLSEAPSPAI